MNSTPRANSTTRRPQRLARAPRETRRAAERGENDERAGWRPALSSLLRSPLRSVDPHDRRFGSPSMPLYATEPRYFVAGVSPLNVSEMVPVPPVVATDRAATVMFPAAALPSSQWNSVYWASDHRCPNPGRRRCTCGRRVDEVDLLGRRTRPLPPTCVVEEDAEVDVVRAVREVVEQREACIRRAGRTATSCFCAFGKLGEHVESVGSSSTVRDSVTAGTRPRAAAANGPS